MDDLFNWTESIWINKIGLNIKNLLINSGFVDIMAAEFPVSPWLVQRILYW